MTAPMMPGPGERQDRAADDSQRVAPSATIASRWTSGTAVMTSREIVTIVGRIMIVRMTPALNRPMPYGGPAKTGSSRADRHDPWLDRRRAGTG